ncbi:hypothetical protein FJY90_01895 [Candidatus Gottesmanbacteria bacterium]|nr:hypothetical protein [Candidatus Gottesmanbacteria bacterium]
MANTDIPKIISRLPLLNSPFSTNLDIKKIVESTNFYRLRIGKVRIIFEILNKEKEVWIRKIGYRGGIYR